MSLTTAYFDDATINALTQTNHQHTATTWSMFCTIDFRMRCSGWLSNCVLCITSIRVFRFFANFKLHLDRHITRSQRTVLYDSYSQQQTKQNKKITRQNWSAQKLTSSMFLFSFLSVFLKWLNVNIIHTLHVEFWCLLLLLLFIEPFESDAFVCVCAPLHFNGF